MSEPYIRTRMNIFAAPGVGLLQPVRVTVGHSYEDDGELNILLCVWSAEGPLIGELSLNVTDSVETATRMLEASACRPGTLQALLAEVEAGS